MDRRLFGRTLKALACLAALATAGAAPSAFAAPAKPSGMAWVNVVASDGAPGWKARAIQSTLWQFLSGFERISLADSVGLSDLGCGPKDLNCLLKAARLHGIDIVILGDLRGRELRVGAYETWTKTLVKERTLPLDESMSLTELRHRVFNLVKPFVEIGGLIDQQAALAPQNAPARNPPPGAAATKPDVKAWTWATFPLFLLFLGPVLFFEWLSRKFKVRLRHAGLMRTVCFLACLVLPLLWLLAPYLTSPPPEVTETLAQVPKNVLKALPAFKYFKGGAAWASVLVLAHRFAVPHIRGMERVGHQALIPLLKAWAAVVLVKVLLLGLAWSPFVAAGIALSGVLALDMPTTWTIVVPFAILIGTAWYLVWITYFSLFLDTQLVSGAPDASNSWHFEVKKYFKGYINRLQIKIDERLFSRTLFLPAKSDQTFTYGGGLVKPRIVLSSWMLPYALGPLPGKTGDDDGTEGFADYSIGTLAPVLRKKEAAGKRSFRNPFGPRRAHELPAPREQAAPAFNLHRATILGYVSPSKAGESVPLIANNREDFQVVSDLLTEHYSKFARDQEDHELDDTDPTDKDFLFGALMREQALIEHGDHLISTFYLGLRFSARAFPARIGKAAEFFRTLYENSFSKYPALLADAYACLNLGADHIIQYLYYLIAGRRQILTARADNGGLAAVSNQVFQAIGQLEVTKEDKQPYRATLRNRIFWLSELFFGAPVTSHHRFSRAVTRALTATLAVVIAGAYVGNSIKYHGIYLKRMQQMKIRILEQQTRLKQEQNNAGNHK